nr:protein-L-isoaspartate O-methyltransferase [Sphingomonas sp. 37zxx]
MSRAAQGASNDELTGAAVARHAMVVSQLRTSGVSDARIIAAMADVPRENFLPPEVRSMAYRDTMIALTPDRQQNTPLATARLLNEARIAAGERVLLIGATGGYTAAVLARLACEVVALESDPLLAAQAREALAGVEGVELVEAPLHAGWSSGAPYDVIVIDGAVEEISGEVIDQLRPEGRVVSGVVDHGVTRLAAGRRTAGGFGLFDFADIDCVVLPGFARPTSFRF